MQQQQHPEMLKDKNKACHRNLNTVPSWEGNQCKLNKVHCGIVHWLYEVDEERFGFWATLLYTWEVFLSTNDRLTLRFKTTQGFFFEPIGGGLAGVSWIIVPLHNPSVFELYSTNSWPDISIRIDREQNSWFHQIQQDVQILKQQSRPRPWRCHRRVSLLFITCCVSVMTDMMRQTSSGSVLANVR